ncbi:MAG: hypothetical protein IT444_10940 [Phycisphaeraceae bacterium]|nr:hypothetical protein [Phycisphaeraceae bacterium]
MVQPGLAVEAVAGVEDPVVVVAGVVGVVGPVAHRAVRVGRWSVSPWITMVLDLVVLLVLSVFFPKRRVTALPRAVLASFLIVAIAGGFSFSGLRRAMPCGRPRAVAASDFAPLFVP